jgi:hypothetical protein
VRPIDKFKSNGNLDLETDHNFGQSGAPFVKKEDAAKLKREAAMSKTNEGFDRKMTNQESGPPALEVKPKFRLRSSLRSSYFQRDARRLRPKNVFSHGGEEYALKRHQWQHQTDAKTIGDKSNCDIQTKLNQQLDGLSQIERDLHQLKVQERYKKKEQMDRFKHLKKPLRTHSAFHISEDKYEMIKLADKYPNNPKMQDYKKKLLELEEDNDCKF